MLATIVVAASALILALLGCIALGYELQVPSEHDTLITALERRELED